MSNKDIIVKDYDGNYLYPRAYKDFEGNVIHSTYVKGVKGNAESTYRTGNVNLTPANVGAVDKTGDTMTGTLKTTSVNPFVFDGQANDFDLIRVAETNNQWGIGVAFGCSGGMTVIGAGESANYALDDTSIDKTAENLYLTADSNVYICTNSNTWGNRKTISINADGSINHPSGSIWVGDTSQTGERDVGVASAAGQMYMYAAGTSTGNRGIYLPAHGTGAAKSAIVVDTNNNVTFNGTATNANNVKAKSGSYKSVADALLEMIYPVGSIYITVNGGNNYNPSNFLGGTWVRITDTFLYCGTDSGTYQVGKSGGSKTSVASHTHPDATFRVRNSNYNTIQEDANVTRTSSTSWGYSWDLYSTSGRASDLITIQTASEGIADGNMPPWLAVYVWKRTA